MQSEDRYRQLIEDSLLGIMVHRKGRILFANQAAADILGYATPQALVDLKDIQTYVAPDDRARTKGYADARLRGEEAPTDYEFQAIRKDDSPAWVRNQVRIVEWEGEPAIQVHWTDVTQTKATEQALRESEARFRDFAEVASDWFWETDVEHRFLYQPANAATVTGYTNDAIKGKTRFDIRLPDDQDDGNWARHQEDLESRRTFRNFEYPAVDASGKHIWLRVGGKPRFGPNGHFLGYHGTASDITQRKQAEARAEQAHSRLVDAIESLHGGFTLVDSDGQLVMTNKRFLEFYAEVAHLFVPGAKFDDTTRGIAESGLIPEARGREDEWFVERIERHNHPGLPFERQVGPDLWLLASERKTSDGGSVMITTDITALKKAEGALKTLNEELEQRVEERTHQLVAAKEAADAANLAKSVFLSRMSHELRTPMNAVLGFGQILQADPEEPLGPNQSVAVNEILKSGKHLLELINDILDLARIESGTVTLSVKAVDLGSVIETCLTLAEPMAKKRGIDLVNKVAGADPANVLADETRFRQALLNLVSNAVKYNCDGGAVTVDAEETEDGMVRVSVADTGPGIAIEKQDQLFEPFNRLGAKDGTIEGTGIGLTITKQLVELMNGRIGFESSEGKGSIFWIELPLTTGHDRRGGHDRRVGGGRT